MTTSAQNRRKADAPDQRITEIDDQLIALTKKVDEIYEIVAAAKGFFKVLGAIGAAVKWLMMVCGAIGAAWLAFRQR